MVGVSVRHAYIICACETYINLVLFAPSFLHRKNIWPGTQNTWPAGFSYDSFLLNMQQSTDHVNKIEYFCLSRARRRGNQMPLLYYTTNSMSNNYFS